MVGNHIVHLSVFLMQKIKESYLPVLILFAKKYLRNVQKKLVLPEKSTVLNHCANPNCKKVISRSNKFCSNKCNGILKRFSDEEYRLKIIKRIKQFYINKHRIPFKVLFTEEFEALKEARKRELYYKSGAGRRKLKEFFKSRT